MSKKDSKWVEWDEHYTTQFLKQAKEQGIPSFSGVSIRYASKQRLSQRLALTFRKLIERLKNALKGRS